MSQHPQQKIGFLDIIWRYKFHLVVYIFVVSFISFAALYFFGGVPDELRVLDTTTPVATTEASTTPISIKPLIKAQNGGQSPSLKDQGELPVHVIISKIG